MNDGLGERAISQTAYQRLEPAECARLDAVTDARAIDVTADEPGVLENLEVLRDGALGQRQFVHDVAADTGVPANQDPKDLDASRMPEGLGESCQLIVGVVALDRSKVRQLDRGRAAGLDGISGLLGKLHR